MPKDWTSPLSRNSHAQAPRRSALMFRIDVSYFGSQLGLLGFGAGMGTVPQNVATSSWFSLALQPAFARSESCSFRQAYLKQDIERLFRHYLHTLHDIMCILSALARFLKQTVLRRCLGHLPLR